MYMWILKIIWVSWVSERMTHFQLLKEMIKLKPHPHSPPPVVSPPLTRPRLRLLPWQIRSSVTSSFLVPDISFIFWLSLIFIKTYNCYILSSIPKFCSKIFFFQVFWSYSSVHRFLLCTDCVHSDLRGGLPWWIRHSIFTASLSASVGPLQGEGLWNGGTLQLILPMRKEGPTGKDLPQGQAHCTWTQWDTAAGFIPLEASLRGEFICHSAGYGSNIKSHLPSIFIPYV